MEERGDRFMQVEEQFAGYEVYDRNGEKIGKVDDLFIDENDRAEYLGVKMGLFGLSGTTLVPTEMVTVQEARSVIEVAADKDKVKDGPSFGDGEEITPEFEREVRSYYGLKPAEGTTEREPYGAYYETEREDDLREEDELRVQRTEEELRAGTREREAGSVTVRKRVRTDREQISVPTRHEEVSVERMPVEEGREASEAEIGEDEVTMPVTEEEVVVEKRPVAKEEIRLRKGVVEDEEVVEEDVRREEVDVEDETERRDA